MHSDTFIMHSYFTEPWQILVAVIGALAVGISKTGVSGLGILVTAVFALLLPARLASGFVLPMLIFGDMVAVLSYRKHADWGHVLRLFPWAIPGVVLGYFAMGRIDDRGAQILIGSIIALMVLWQGYRRFFPKAGAEPGHEAWLVALLGIAAGFTTLVANAAGPIMTLYLLAIGLPKLEFVGTAAVFFCALNLFKVPFMANLGLITRDSFGWNLALAPAVLVGTFAGKWLLKRISQRWFELVALSLSALAALKLLW